MYRYVFVFLLMHAGSIFAAQWLHVTITTHHFVSACSVLIVFYFLTTYTIAKYCFAVLLAVMLAFTSVSLTTHTATPKTIDTYANNRFIRLQGIISGEPDRRPMQTKYTMAVQKILNASGATIMEVDGTILVTERRQWPKFYYGDTVHVSGVLEKPGLINETFYYDRYLSRYGIYSVMYSGSLRKNTQSSASAIHNAWRKIFAFKEFFEAQINRIHPEPHASFMAGLLTGSRKGIPAKVLEDFNTTGLTHIIAISGYNITIIIVIITNALFWLPKRYRLVPAVFSIILFTIFVGASAAVVRAAIMGSLGLLALHTGNQNTARITMLWTLFCMTSINPKYLWYDAGFQLSFLAVIGLLEVSPLLEKYTKYVPQILGLRESLQMTLAAQISAVPLLMILFGRFSLIAPLANILVAPLLPLAMLFGFIGTIVSLVYFPLGQIISYPAWGMLELIIQIAHNLSNIPYASINLPTIHWLYAVLYYVTLVGGVLYYNKKSCL